MNQTETYKLVMPKGCPCPQFHKENMIIYTELPVWKYLLIAIECWLPYKMVGTELRLCTWPSWAKFLIEEPS